MPMPTERPAASAGTIGTAAYKVQFEAPPGEYIMRVVVREPGGSARQRRSTLRRSAARCDGRHGKRPRPRRRRRQPAGQRRRVQGRSAGGPRRALRPARPTTSTTVTVTAQLASLTEKRQRVHADLGEIRARGNGSVSREARSCCRSTGVVAGRLRRARDRPRRRRDHRRARARGAGPSGQRAGRRHRKSTTAPRIRRCRSRRRTCSAARSRAGTSESWSRPRGARRSGGRGSCGARRVDRGRNAVELPVRSCASEPARPGNHADRLVWPSRPRAVLRAAVRCRR